MMESYQSQEVPDLTAYQDAAIGIITLADTLLTSRNVPQKPGLTHIPNRSQELQLTDVELAGIAPIFDAHVLDAPESLRIWLTATYPTSHPRPRLECSEVLFISTTHEDVKTSYRVWIVPQENLITFAKDAMRITPSAIPYTIGPFSCEAEYLEILADTEVLTDGEQETLRELLEFLQ